VCYKLAVLAYRSLHGTAPQYLTVPPHVGVGGHWTSVPAICCSTETDRSMVPSEDVWLLGVFGGKSVSLECITGQSERSRADFRHFQASCEDLLLHVILDVSHVQRIGDFLVMCYINVRFTYLHDAEVIQVKVQCAYSILTVSVLSHCYIRPTLSTRTMSLANKM